MDLKRSLIWLTSTYPMLFISYTSKRDSSLTMDTLGSCNYQCHWSNVGACLIENTECFSVGRPCCVRVVNVLMYVLCRCHSVIRCLIFSWKKFKNLDEPVSFKKNQSYTFTEKTKIWSENYHRFFDLWGTHFCVEMCPIFMKFYIYRYSTYMYIYMYMKEEKFYRKNKEKTKNVFILFRTTITHPVKKARERRQTK